MANKVLSIEIGYTLTKVCEVDYKVKNPKVYNCFTFQTPDGAFEDGYIKRTDEFSERLMQEIQGHGIKTKQVVFTMTSSKIANREIYIPFVKENKIFSLVETNAKDYFPVDLSTYQLSYSIMDTVEKEGNKQYKLLVLAAPKDLLESYYTLCGKAKLTITALDYSGNSIVPIVRNACTDEPSMVIKVDERSTMLTVFINRNIILQRNIAYGADIAVEALIDSLPEEEKSISYLEAMKTLREKFCIRKSFNPTVQDEGDVDISEEEEQARTELTEALHMMVSSIIRVVDYYNSRNADAQIERFYLTGMGADFNNLGLLIGSELGAKVVVMSHLDGVSLDKIEKNSEIRISIGEYLACIGAAVAPVDFIPDEHKDKKHRKSSPQKKKGEVDSNTALPVILLAGGLLIAVVLVCVSVFGYITVSSENTKLKARVAELEPIEVVYQDYQKSQKLFEDVTAMEQATANPNEKLLDFLKEMEVKMPSEIAVQNMSGDMNQISITMNVGSKEAAGNAIAAFRTFESLSKVEVLSITEDMDEAGNIVENFTMVGTYAVNTVSDNTAVAAE